jgi:hypothetical protein
MKTYKPNFLKLYIEIIFLYIIFTFANFIIFPISKLGIIIYLIISPIICFLIIGQFTKPFYSEIMIVKNKITFKNKKGIEISYSSNDIKQIIVKKISGKMFYGIILVDSKKINPLLLKTKTTILFRIINYFVLLFDSHSKIHPVKTKDKNRTNILKIREHNYSKYGFHMFIIADYYNHKEQLLTELNKFTKINNAKNK